MADKEVIINSKTLVHGQGVKESMSNSSAGEVECFDEVIIDGSDVATYKLDIDRVVFETREDYETLRDEFKKMTKVKGDITTREVIRYVAEEPFVIVKNYHGCILDTKDYEMKVKDKTAEKLSFKCASMEEYTEDYTE